MQSCGCIFSCSSGKWSRESFSSSLLLLASSKTGGKIFVEPADATNYTSTLIRFSLSGCQETEHVAQFIPHLWDSFCWTNDSKPAVKEAILPSAGEVTALREPFLDVMKSWEYFHFSGISKFSLYLWNMEGWYFPASENWKLGLTLILILQGWSVGEDFPLNRRWFIDLFRNWDNNEIKA